MALDICRQLADNDGMKTDLAIQHFGSRKALAAALGVGRTATYWWGETIPDIYQYKIQVLTDGALVAEKQKILEQVSA